jgi:hypothetical protein
MARSFTSVVSSKPLRFLITGSIAAWDPIRRRLKIDGRRLWVAPAVAVSGVADGALVTASGHQEHPSARWIVTDFAFDAPRPRSAGNVPLW